MKPQFTGGPWRYEHRPRGHPSFNILVARHAVIVAKAWVVEDARLIAAAPELYEALDFAVTGLRSDTLHGDNIDRFFELATAALAKSRGDTL